MAFDITVVKDKYCPIFTKFKSYAYLKIENKVKIDIRKMWVIICVNYIISNNEEFFVNCQKNVRGTQIWSNIQNYTITDVNRHIKDIYKL